MSMMNISGGLYKVSKGVHSVSTESIASNRTFDKRLFLKVTSLSMTRTYIAP